MAIDASIPAGVALPRITFDPARALNQVADLQVAQFRMQEARRKSMAQMRMRQLAQEHPNDPDAFVDALGAEFPEEAAGFSEQLSKARKEGALANKAATEADLTNIEFGVRALQMAQTDPRLYKPARAWILERIPQMGSVLKDEYDPEKVAGVLQLGQKTSDYLKAQQQSTDLFLDGKTQQGVANLFANSTTPEQWKATQEYVSQAGKQARQLASLFGEFSPESVARAGQMAMSAEQRGTAADRAADNQRQAEQFAETQRHNLATEGTAAVSARRMAAAQAEQARHNRVIENKPTGAAADEGGLVDAVISNPSLWDELTPTVKGKIAPELQAKGFTGFGKPLSNAAVKEIAQSKSAIDGLNDLKASLKENENFVGPFAGLQALNPYSDARKVQAKIDLQRQRVGKALEGGVLRKEDEEKYKKILSVLTDEPSTAQSKIDGVIAAIEQDIRNYTNEQRLAGRRVNPESTANVGPGYGKAIEVKAPNGKTYKFQTQAQANEFKKRAGIQ